MTTEPKPEEIDMEAGTGTSIIRWEAASGLEHTCFACPTKANHPKARQSCYGIHSMPCYRYHPTMHAIGTSHNCFACIQADNQHHERHRRILELQAEYLALTEVEALASVKNKKGRGHALHERDPNIPVQYHNNNPHHHAHLANLDHDEQENDLAIPANEAAEIASVSAPSTTSSGNTSTSTGTKMPKPTKAEQRAAKREAKDAKSRRKSLKNQNKYTGLVIRADEIESLAKILHGEGNTDESHPLASDKCIEDVMERNRRYVTSISEHKALLLKEVGRTRKVEQERERDRVRKARKRKERDSVSNGSGQTLVEHGLVMDEEQEPLVNAVLIRLGISVEAVGAAAGEGAGADGGGPLLTQTTPVTPKRANSAGKSSQETAMVLAQLRVAIAEDLLKHENEQRQTCVRAGGFWRYVGRPVFDRMMEVAERIDWRTGMLMKSKKALEGGAAAGDGEDGGAEDGVANDVDDGDALREAVDNVREWVDVVADPNEGVGPHQHVA